MSNIIIATLGYAFFQVLSGFGAKKISDIWFLISGAISIVFFTFLITSYYKLKQPDIGEFNFSGFMFVFLANAGVAVFTLYLGRSFQEYSATFVIPLLFGAAIALSTIVGFIISARIPTFPELSALTLVVGGLIMYSFVANS